MSSNMASRYMRSNTEWLILWALSFVVLVKVGFVTLVHGAEVAEYQSATPTSGKLSVGEITAMGKSQRPTLPECGVWAAWMFMRLNGVEVPVEKLEYLAETNLKEGASLSEILEACEKFGLSCRAVRCPHEELAALPLPFISHLVPSDLAAQAHYVVVVNMDLNHVECFDWSYKRFVKVTRKEFLEHASGNYLIVPESRSLLSQSSTTWGLLGVVVLLAISTKWNRVAGAPLDVTTTLNLTSEKCVSICLLITMFSGCDISAVGNNVNAGVSRPKPVRRGTGLLLGIDEPSRQFGGIRPGTNLDAVFELVNQSSSVVRISVARTSCGCVSPKLTARELVPSGKAQLSVNVHSADRMFAGPVGESVIVLAESEVDGKPVSQEYEVDMRATILGIAPERPKLIVRSSEYLEQDASLKFVKFFANGKEPIVKHASIEAASPQAPFKEVDQKEMRLGDVALQSEVCIRPFEVPLVGFRNGTIKDGVSNCVLDLELDGESSFATFPIHFLAE